MKEGLRRQDLRKKVERSMSFDGSSSKNRIDIQDKPKFKKLGSNQVPTKFQRASGDRVSNPKFKKGKSSNSPKEKPTYGKCCKKNYVECLKGMDNCCSCGKSCHKIKDCPNLKNQNKGSGQSKV